MNEKLCLIAIFLVAIPMTFAKTKIVLGGEKRTIGWLENVYLVEHGFAVRTKIDTGAKNSSIHAENIEYLEPQGTGEGLRIRFRTFDIKRTSRTIEADVLRQVRIKKPNAHGDARPEVEMDICLAGVRKRIRVNLADRKEMNYRMILGRTALEGDFIVDVSQKYTAGSRCQVE